MKALDNYECEGQLTIFDVFGQDTWSGKTSQEHSVQTKEKTSELSLKKPQRSPIKMPLFLDLRRGRSGLLPEPSWETGGLLLGEYMMHSFGECPKEENASRLSQILEENPHPKYSLSAKACQGILRRAENRGKELPPLLKETLLKQSASKSEQESREGAKESLSNTNGQELCQPSTTKVYCLQGNAIDRADTAGCNDSGIAVLTYQEKVGTVDCGIAKGTGNQLANQDMFVANGTIVRRLTPLECERLQGYPDGWSDIGEWIDSKGKKHKDADSPRYKALGNSIALPFWQWLADRIVAQYDRPTTMASLFDGIGGFPLVFSRCGCEPEWASEIEEFPIAVTKIRFPGKEET